MAGTKGNEAIVAGHEEKGGWKRFNDDKDADLAKRVKVEGNEAAGGREEEKEDLKAKVDRLRGLLEDDPKKLENRDVEDVICLFGIDEIISLALKSYKGEESKQCCVAEVENWMEEEGDCKKIGHVIRSMLCCIEVVKRAEIRLVHEKLSPKAFTTLLLAALDAKHVRRSWACVPVVEAEDRDIMPILFCVLPWELIAHVLKRWIPRLDDETDVEEEEEEEECARVQKEAAENCDICLGKGRHTAISGEYCTFKDAIPNGASVGPNYVIVCSSCGYPEFSGTFQGCFDCGHEVGKAVSRRTWLAT